MDQLQDHPRDRMDLSGDSHLSVTQGPTVEPTHDSLLVDLNAVRYELATIKQERDLEKLSYEREVRALERKVQEDGKSFEQERNEKNFIFERHQSLAQELEDVRQNCINEKTSLESRLREKQSEYAILSEGFHELETEYSSFQRNMEREVAKLNLQIQNLQELNESLSTRHESNEALLQRYQNRVLEQENELLQPKGSNDGVRKPEDVQTLALLKREFSEQSRHIKSLEAKNRKLESENEELLTYSKSISILEEEKRFLKGKLEAFDGLREHISNLELQKAILEEEKTAWSAFLQDESNDLSFSSPAHLARAYMQEKIEKQTLLERFGRSDTNSVQKDKEIEAILAEKSSLEEEIRTLKQTARKDSKDRQRLERQKELAIKEANFLREQLKTYSTEETVMMGGNYDDQKSQRIDELESLLEEHRREIESLTQQLEDREIGIEASVQGVSQDRNGSLGNTNSRISNEISLLRDELDKTHNSHQLALVEINALRKQLGAAEATSNMRILQLKDNPTSRHEITKAETLQTLRNENAALLAQLESQPGGVKVVPISTLERCRSDVKEMESLVAEKEKRMLRLKEMWAKKALEFRQAVYSILGYEVDFQPNGRVKVTSMFHRPDLYGGVDTGIVFDGEQGTMKLCGGPNSQFAREIRNQLKFYVEERKEIPCFLAALTMEGYEKTTRAQC